MRIHAWYPGYVAAVQGGKDEIALDVQTATAVHPADPQSDDAFDKAAQLKVAPSPSLQTEEGSHGETCCHVGSSHLWSDLIKLRLSTC